MPITLKAVPKSASKTRIPLDEIDEDVKTAVDEALAYCAEHPDERVSAEFGTQEEADSFLKTARSYAYQREPRVVLEGNTTQKGAARFTVVPYTAGDSDSEAA